ncbi:MAG: aspartate--tRNA ligase [Planctomycetota bacterium]|jgi:aspartyl-tRNA synthetase
MSGMRTHTCGELDASHAGRKVRLCGWVAKVRDHGGIVFVNLRDRWGVTQAVFRPEREALHAAARGLKVESVISVDGEVRARPEGLRNPNMATGEIEVEGVSLEVLGPAEPTPFVVADQDDLSPELRMQYRYLDLRRPGQLDRLVLRHRLAQLCRRLLNERDFVEVETPMLTRSTPEGARDYIVPSRVSRGAFYALPQSPQLFKQLLMVAGLERYYQIVRCFRDEDLRSDRQPEFTQLDIEMSFVGQEEVMAVAEAVLAAALEELAGVALDSPLLRIPYDVAMARYGIDKPDLRFGLEIEDVSSSLSGCGFRIFETALEAGGVVRGLRVEGGGSLSRKQVDGLEVTGVAAGLKGLVAMKVGPDGPTGPAAKRFKEGVAAALTERMKAREGDLLLFAAGADDDVAPGLGAVRLHLGRALGLAKSGFAACWVVDPPLFTKNAETGLPDPSHHAFTMPAEEDPDVLSARPFAVKARGYDLVLNGQEIAGGSVRIHRADIQKRVFELLGIGPEEAREKFGFLLEAFRYGAPPHAGIAFGFDRFAALLAGQDQIREVIAFPKTTKAICPLTGAPARLDPAQLKALGITVTGDH